jgi:hypothetical protein
MTARNSTLPRPDLGPAEAGVVGSLLTVGTDPLPTTLARLVAHAPESFDDMRHGLVAVAVRQLLANGQPVDTIAIHRELTRTGTLESAGGVGQLMTLANAALPLGLAESEAASLWQFYQTRQTRSLLSEAQAELDRSPDNAGAVAAMASRALTELADEPATGSGLTTRTPDELLALPDDASDNLLGDRLLTVGGSLVVAGPGGIGKSRLLLQLAACCIVGRQWLGLETRAAGKRWLVLQAENSNRRLRFDLAKLREWVGESDWPQVNANLTVHTLETDLDSLLSLDDPEACDRIRALIQLHKPDVVAVDSLYNVAAGDLNADNDMRQTVLSMSRVIRAGNPRRSIVCLHHALTGKAGAARAVGWDRASYGRNSKVLHQWTRGQVNLAPASPDDAALLVVSCGKTSDGREFAPFAIRLDPATMVYTPEQNFDLAAWQADVSGERQKSPAMDPEKVAGLCRVPTAKGELAKLIMEDCGCYRGSAYRYIARAESARKIKRNPTNELYSRR